MIVIVGGSGFIGTNLSADLNSSGKDFKIYDKSEETPFTNRLLKGNILDKDFLINSLAGTSTVVNLAAEHKDNVKPISLYYDVNVVGARVLCEACETNNINRIIFTSSVAVYGLNKPNPDENFPVDPFNDYGKSKYEAEQVYLEWQQRAPQQRSLIIIRPTVVFGEGNRGNVYNLLSQIASGKFLRIGNGNNKKSMAYVKNISSFINHSISHFKEGVHIFNYVDKPDLSMNEFIEVCESSLSVKIPNTRIPYFVGYLGGLGFDLLSKVTGRRFSISSVRIKKFCATTQFDALKAHTSGFKAPYSLEEGLNNTLKSEFE